MATPIRELLISVKVEADGKPLDKIGESTDKTKVKSAALGTALGTLGADLVKLGAEAVKAAAAFAIDLVTGFAESGDEVIKTAQKMGVAVDELQRLRFAGERSGIASEQLTAGLGDFNTALQEGILTGGGPAVQFLGDLGLKLEDLAELGAEDRLGLVADAFGNITDESEASALAVKLFGGAGKDILPLLREGSAGISALGDEAEELGGVMSEEAAASAAELADSLFNLDTFLAGTTRGISEALAPAASDFIDQFQELIANNDDFIQQDLPELLREMGELFLEVLPVVIDTVKAFADIGDEVEDLNERMSTDFPAAWALAGAAVESLLLPITLVGDAVEAVLDSVTKAASQIESLQGLAASVRAGLGLDETATVSQRGLAGVDRVTTEVFEGGTEENAGRSALTIGEGRKIVSAATGRVRSGPVSSDEQLSAIIADPSAPNDVKARAAEILDDRFVASMIEETTRQFEENEKADARADLLRRAGEGRRKAVGKRGRGSGGGGGGSPAPVEQTLDELIAGAVGVPGSQAGSGGSALSGTVLSTVNNIFRPEITIEQITVDIPADSVRFEETDAGQLAAIMRPVAMRALTDQLREPYNRFVAGGTP